MVLRQRPGPAGAVSGDSRIAEFDTGLHHHGDHPLPGVLQTGFFKSVIIQRQDSRQIEGVGDLDVAAVFQTTTGNRYLVADDIDGLLIRRRVVFDGLGGPAEVHCPLDHRIGGQRGPRVVGARDRRIEMNLVEPGPDTGLYQFPGALHGHGGGFRSPQVGTEVVRPD